MRGCVLALLLCLLARTSLADTSHHLVLGARLDARLPPLMVDQSNDEHRQFLNTFAVVDAKTPIFTVVFSETYGTAPTDLVKAMNQLLRSMELKRSTEKPLRIVDQDVSRYCVRPASNVANTRLVCLVSPKNDTVKVVAFSATRWLDWRNAAIEIVTDIKAGAALRWGGPARIGGNVLTVDLEDEWAIDIEEVQSLTYRLLRRSKFGDVGPHCEVSLSACVDPAGLTKSVVNPHFNSRFSCSEATCRIQLENVWKGYCLLASCGDVVTSEQRSELEKMFRSVAAVTEPRGF